MVRTVPILSLYLSQPGYFLNVQHTACPKYVLCPGMAASKLNTFHWHLTDSQSFPYDSAQFPEMARWGAYSGNEIYTPEDVKELSTYARIRGVRVLVEIDSPAHAGAGWQWGRFPPKLLRS